MGQKRRQTKQSNDGSSIWMSQLPSFVVFLIGCGLLYAISEYGLLPFVLLVLFAVVVLYLLLGYRRALRNPRNHSVEASPATFLTKDIYQPSPTFLKIGIGTGSGCSGCVFLTCGFPVLLSVVTLIVSEESVWHWRGDYRGPLVLLACGLPFALAGFGLLFLQWRFTFDKRIGKMTAGSFLFKRNFPLSAVQSVELSWGGGLPKMPNRPRISGGWSDDSISSGSNKATQECRLVMIIDDDKFRLSLWNHTKWGKGQMNAERLARFLDVPIGGDAYTPEKRD